MVCLSRPKRQLHYIFIVTNNVAQHNLKVTILQFNNRTLNAFKTKGGIVWYQQDRYAERFWNFLKQQKLW